jgi:hypothetical protein
MCFLRDTQCLPPRRYSQHHGLQLVARWFTWRPQQNASHDADVAKVGALVGGVSGAAEGRKTSPVITVDLLVRLKIGNSELVLRRS